MKVQFPGFRREARRFVIKAVAAACVRIAKRSPKPRPLRAVLRATTSVGKEFRREMGRARRRIEGSRGDP